MGLQFIKAGNNNMATTVANDAMSNLDSILSLLDKKVPGLLHQAYGYILLVVFATYMVAFVQGFLVGKARTKYKVELPTMYSDTEQMFNCIYSVGYYSGVPNNRIVGSLMNVLTEQALLVMIFIQAVQMADWWTIDQSWAAY